MAPPTYTRLDMDNCVFLFVDHQSVRDFDASEFCNNVLVLVKIAKYFGAPPILTTSFDTEPNGSIAKEIADELPDAPLIRRPRQINAMDNDDLVQTVKATGKKQVIIRNALH